MCTKIKRQRSEKIKYIKKKKKTLKQDCSSLKIYGKNIGSESIVSSCCSIVGNVKCRNKKSRRWMILHLGINDSFFDSFHKKNLS